MSMSNGSAVDLNTGATQQSRPIVVVGGGERATVNPAMSLTLTATQSATSTGDDGQPETQTQSNSADHRGKNHRRQESMYTMTGLYSETNAAINSSDDEDEEEADESTNRRRNHFNRRTDEYAADDDDDERYAETTELTGSQPTATSAAVAAAKNAHHKPPPGVQPGCDAPPQHQHTTSESDTAIGCHSRQPSGGLIGNRDKPATRAKLPPTSVATCIVDASYEQLSSQDCGLLSCRPAAMQKFARIKIFVLLLSMLVTLQQALSSGYINSVITTIEKRFDIPSSYSGLIASSYEIGNVITVIFVSYLGSRRHIPVWIGIGAVIMGIGSLIFMVPHFTGDDNPGISLANKSSDNICRGVSLREPDMDLGRLSSGLANPPLAPHNNLREDNCIQGRSSTRGPVLMFVLAQLLLGCGGSPLFTLGTTYVDDHVRTESASMYIGCMYSMAAFGPVVGFLLGAYLLSFHMDSFAQNFVGIDPGDRRWVGMWWGGFLVCGVLLILVAIPFFSFPKVLTYERKKLRKLEMMNSTVAAAAATVAKSGSLQRNPPAAMSTSSSQLTAHAPEKSEKPPPTPPTPPEPLDSGYGQDIKDIPRSMWRLVSNPVYITTCLGACMELMIVSGFIVFLPKYLETQFSLGKSQASVFTGSIAIPGACIGIFMGGCFLKRFQLTPRGAVQFVLVSNLICLSCYTLLFFLGCENLKMAGTTIPYYNSSTHMSQTPREPFQVNLTAACNFGCECRMTDVEPVCGNNGLTYFSPCHAGCTAFSETANYTNCACVHANVTNFYAGVGGSQAQASVASADFAEVTMVPVATAGPCTRPCRTIYPFLILLFFMTFIVASTQMPLLMIVLRSVSEEERSFALGMQFVIFRLFGYIPAPILFGNLIDSTCLLWKSTCGEKGGRCLIYNIEAFRYKYVGLCAVIKIVALVIFGIDWWLVTRKKCIDDDVPMAKEDMSGSMLSLNNASIHRSAAGANGDAEDFHPIIATSATAPAGSAIQLTYENSKRILVASRHLRNESKTIQLEMRYDDSGSGSDRPPPPIAATAPLRSRNTHYRSSSCDVKMMRDEDAGKPKRPAPASGHSRTNSRDLASNTSEFRAKLTHSRQNSSDRHNANIKYILNYLNTSKLLVPAANLGCPSGGVATRRQHTRNHSYDQIYMPQNIRIDQEFQRRFNKNVSRKNSVAAAKVADPPAVAAATAPSSGVAPSGGQGAAASKDLHLMNIMLTEDSAGNSVLRHRRTSSKDLGRLMAAGSGGAASADQLPEAGGGSGAVVSPKHVRQSSQHRIQIEDATIAEADTDAV